MIKVEMEQEVGREGMVNEDASSCLRLWQTAHDLSCEVRSIPFDCEEQGPLHMIVFLLRARLGGLDRSPACLLVNLQQSLSIARATHAIRGKECASERN